ncbi:MAG: hypothetical protein J6C35_01930 [Bacteroidales bacterium]|nr:hypothetical protein [Bacteroidales bacterium]
MKIGQFFKKMVGGSMILAALACPVFNSCADFGTDIEGLKGDLEDLENRVVALEQRLNTDLAALQTLLQGQIDAINGEIDGINGDIAELLGKVNGLVTVKECKTNANGEYEITLSDGTKFTVYPEFEQDYKGIVTTVTLDGVVYWAMFDENGTPKAMTDAEGNLIPVVDAVPQTKKGEDGLFYVSFDGGNTWEPTGVSEPCVFAGAEIIYTDNYTDEQEAADPEWNVETPMYVVLTLADGNTITVTLDGAATFSFGNPYMGPAPDSQYIPFGQTTTVQFAGTNIESWIKEVPSGWKVEENVADFAQYGMGEFVITAPSAEAVASGAAVAEGYIKVLAIAEGGKSITAKCLLTTNAFSEMSASKGNLTVKMNNGLGGYLVGVSKVGEFDAEAIQTELKSVVEAVEWVEDWWTGELTPQYTWSPWYTDMNATPLDDNYLDSSVEGYSMERLKLVEPLEVGAQYMVWAAALNMDMVTYSYTVGEIKSVSYLNAFINLDEAETVVTFNDIQISAEFVGVEMFYGGFEQQYPGYASTPADIVAQINEGFSYGYGPSPIMVNDEYVEGWKDGVFTGNPNDLVSGYQSVVPDATYYLYIIPAIEGKTVYSVDDVYWYEFTTEALMPGGKVNVTAGEPTLDYKKIAVPISAENAVYMYYKFIEPEMVTTIADKQAYLLENGAMVKNASQTVQIANLSPATTRTLLAMAVDQYGCYGDVLQQDYTTKTYEYAAATVKAEINGTVSTTGLVKLSSDADVVKYYYWFGSKDSYQWTNTSYLGGSAESASAFIALTPSSYLLKKVTPAELPADGIEMKNLSIGMPSVFVVSAELADGTFTKATVVEFTPSMNLGNFVYATDDNGNENAAWTAAKPVVKYSIDQVGDFTTVAWSVDVPEGFTAKTTCFSQDYLSTSPTAKDKVQFILSYEYIELYDVVEGETYVQPYASKGYNIYTVISDAQGNYYETYVEKLDISGGFGV